MAKKRPTRPATTRDEKLNALQEQIAAGVAALANTDAWAQMLDTSARFHHYSARNILLILAQRPDATRVAGFNTWISLDRRVRKGEHGIAILAPTLRTRTADTTEPVDTDEPATDGQPKRILTGFRVAYVFDISQTDGADLPAVRPVALAGAAPTGLWDAITTQIETAGYTVSRGDCGAANGVTNRETRTVTVRPDLDDAQAVRTLTHELAHIVLGHCDEGPICQTRGIRECEAESVAYIVTAHHGMDASSYTFPYVARWPGADPDAMISTADRVVTAARTILDTITPAVGAAA